jgi:hypothetical protein
MRLYNVDHSPAVVRANERAVMPCQPHDFTEGEVAAGLAGTWSAEDPRAGLAQERAFKARRDAKRETASAAETADDAA